MLSVTDANGNAITSPFDIANVNPFRYRGYYYDTETGLYYLQSRYYDSSVGRFLNADVPECTTLHTHAISSNLFIYCNNAPVHLTDYMGNIALVDDVAFLTVGLFALMIILLKMVGDRAFQAWLVSFCEVAGIGLKSIFSGIVDGWKIIWSLTKAQIKILSEAVDAYITVVKAENKIKSKVKKNSKERYWKADIVKLLGYTYVVITSAINYTFAKARVGLGLSVFCVTKSEARRLASNFPPIVGPEIGSKKEGQYLHYHVNDRYNKAHIFYLF